MRNRALHDALREFALESAALLCDEVAKGAELEFDVTTEGARGLSLYCYRPLTAEFIAARWPYVRDLPTCATAATALGAGAAPYLRVSGLRGSQAEPALKAMLERLYEDATDFKFPEERFDRVYREVERTLYEDSTSATVLAPVMGLELAAERVDLGGGLSLARADAIEAPDEAIWSADGYPDDDRDPVTFVMLEHDVTPDDPLPVSEARERFCRLITGLRLYKPGGVGLGPACWARSGDGRWQVTALDAAGVARGEPWILVEGEESELIGFLTALDDATYGGSVAWALARFEMGCERRLDSEALSDYLMALRALLDVSAEQGRGELPLRLAALCAQEGDRRALQRRVELSLALERFVIDGGRDEAYLDSIGSESPRTLVAEVERHLRALLRDVMCGYLETDLRRVAEGILLESPEPYAITARDMREEPAPARPAAAVVDRPAERPRRFASAAPVAPEPPRVAEELPPEPEPVPEGARGLDLETVAGVTAAPLDWDYSDPTSFSAPV